MATRKSPGRKPSKSPRAKSKAKAPDALEAIDSDRRRGAAEVAEKLLEWGTRWGSEEPAAGTVIDTVEARGRLATIARSQAALAPVLRITNDFLLELERREGTDAAAARRAVAAVSDRWRQRLAAATEALGLHLCRTLEGLTTIYTYSASSTVRSALMARYAAGQWFRVVLSEARPGGEGARMAAELAEKGVPVRLGTDAWLLTAMEDEGAFVVGADALLPTRWVNKLGTAALTDRARERGISVVVAADTSKWLPPALASLSRVYDRDPRELVYDPPPSLETMNVYFEEISYSGLDRLITERGVTRPQDLRIGDVPIAAALR